MTYPSHNLPWQLLELEEWFQIHCGHCHGTQTIALFLAKPCVGEKEHHFLDKTIAETKCLGLDNKFAIWLNTTLVLYTAFYLKYRIIIGNCVHSTCFWSKAEANILLR